MCTKGSSAARRVFQMPGWLGPWEIIIVVVIILLIFGGRLLPRLGRSLGGSVVGLKKGLKEGGEGFKAAIDEDAKVDGTEETKVDTAAKAQKNEEA
jgi:sec-independent protein translocase protein TatA